MSKQAAAFVICGLAAASVCFGQVPAAVFHGGDNPGINAPFLINGDVDTYGVIRHLGGFNWADEGEEGYGEGGWTSDWGLARYRPGLAGETNPDNFVPMPTDQDWVLEISFMQVGGFGTEGPWYAKDNAQDLRILGITNKQNGTYGLTASNPDNSMREIAEVSLPADEWGDFVYHYKADTQVIDAYFNGALVAADFTANVYSVDWVQAEWQRLDATWFRNIKLGQYGESTEPVCNPGDADDDGDVDDDDLSLLLANWGGDVDCTKGEFSGEAPVNDDDLSLLLANWTGAVTPVPEPATMTLLALGAWAALARRRR